MSNIYNAIKNNITQEQILRNITKDIIDHIKDYIKETKISNTFIDKSNFVWTDISPHEEDIQDITIADYKNITQNNENNIGITVTYKISYCYEDYSLFEVNIPDSLITAYEDSFINGQRNDNKYSIYQNKLSEYTTELSAVLSKEWEDFKIKKQKSEKGFNI